MIYSAHRYNGGMIIFVNGSFGVGKTSVAVALHKRLSNSLIYDPEEVGFMLRNILTPIEWTGDFQDYPLWRTMVVDVARQLKQQYGRTLIMPMTIRRDDYFAEVMSGLSSVDSNLHHFCLVAPVAVIRQRLIDRGEQAPGDWVFEQVDVCAQSFERELFNERIDTTGSTPEQIAEQILSRLALPAANPVTNRAD